MSPLKLLPAILVCAVACAQSAIAPQTSIPIVLTHTVPLNAPAGTPIKAQLVQRTGGMKKGMRVTGQIIGHPNLCTLLHFDHVGKLPLHAGVRAIASFQAVNDVYTPATGPDRGTVYEWNTFTLIGGAQMYGFNGDIYEGLKKVGHAYGGHAIGRLEANPQAGCPASSSEDDNTLGPFSPDACGVYGFDSLQLKSKDDSPDVLLCSQKKNAKLDTGTHLLLITTK
jgi:hypothetical protein